MNEEEIKQPEQEVFEKQTLTDYLESKQLETFTADLKPEAVRYFIASNEIVLNGQPVPSGGACVSLFGQPFIYMTSEDFEKWIVPNSSKPMPISMPVVEEPLQGKVINSNSDDFDNYVKENKIHTFDAEIIPTRRECFEAREDLKIVTNEGAIFEVKGGDIVIKDLESGNIFKNKADYFNSHYKRIPKEEN